MDPTEVLHAIERGRIAPVYFLHGPEHYWHEAIVRRLREVLLPPGDVLNVTVLDGRAVEWQEVMEQASTVPFLSGRRLVIVRDSEHLLGKDRESVAVELERYLHEPVPTTCLVFRQDRELDGRRSWVRLARERGWVVQCKPLQGEALIRWLQGEAQRWGKELDAEAVAWLMESGDPDLHRLANEVAKAADHAGPRTRITADDVKAVGVAAATAVVFDLVDAIVERRLRQALILVHRLLAAGEPPLRLLALVARQYRILAYACALRARGRGPGDLQSLLQLHPYVARKAWRQARALSVEQALDALATVLAMDVDIKQGRWPERVGFERLVFLLAAPNHRGRRPLLSPRDRDSHRSAPQQRFP